VYKQIEKNSLKSSKSAKGAS